jgi:hypothetical protein
MPYTYQPSGANYCFYHEDGYPVCVGDGKKPSQTASRKSKPHGVPILTKIKDKPNPVEEAQKKKLAKIRKKEYDRLYRAANRKIPSKESKGSLTQTLEMKIEKQRAAKKKLDKLKETNDKLTSIREKKDNKEKALAIAKYESKWDNTDGAKTFKDKMDKVKKQKDSDQKKRQLEKLKDKEKDAEEKHKQMNTKSIKVIEADIKGLEKQEKKAYGIAIIKKDKKIEDFKKDRSAVVIQRQAREFAKVLAKRKEEAAEEESKRKKEAKIQKRIDAYNNVYIPFKALVLANEELVREEGYQNRFSEVKQALNDYEFDKKDLTSGTNTKTMESVIRKINRKMEKFNKKKLDEARKKELEELEELRKENELKELSKVEDKIVKIQAIARRKIKSRYGNLPVYVRRNMMKKDDREEVDKVIKEGATIEDADKVFDRFMRLKKRNRQTIANYNYAKKRGYKKSESGVLFNNTDAEIDNLKKENDEYSKQLERLEKAYPERKGIDERVDKEWNDGLEKLSNMEREHESNISRLEEKLRKHKKTDKKKYAQYKKMLDKEYSARRTTGNMLLESLKYGFIDLR